jgi:hypothetical protein
LVGKLVDFGDQSRRVYFSEDKVLHHETLPEGPPKGLFGGHGADVAQKKNPASAKRHMRGIVILGYRIKILHHRYSGRASC